MAKRRNLSFYFFSSFILCLSLCLSIADAQYSDYVELQITPTESFTINDINTLSLAPGSEIEILDSGAVIAQIPTDAALQLADSGLQTKIIRSFVLVQPSDLSVSTIENVYGENTSDVAIPDDGSSVGSGIDFSAFPPYIITSMDVHYAIRSSWVGFVFADLADYPYTASYNLVYGDSGYISQTKTGITRFNGKTLNTQWVLWVGEGYSSGDGYIDSWWIKIYHENTAPYCSAFGTCVEYLNEVIVGDIDNVSDCDGYGDYSSQSTAMIKGTSYPIEIIGAVDGKPFYGSPGNCLGIWIDWNQDHDFDEADELVYSIEDYGYFTTSITPPETALAGSTRMRIRLAYNETLNPCGGSAQGGEVEDYTIIVQDAPIQKYSGGTGTALDPYLIATPEDLNSIGSNPEDWSANFKQTADIDLFDYAPDKFKIIGTPSQPFTGVFDGDNFSISNFTYTTQSTNFVGLFAYVGQPPQTQGPDVYPVIKNVWLVSATINANHGASLIGFLNGGSCINCFATPINVTCTNLAGGLIAYIHQSESVESCYASGFVSGGDYVGGFVGSFKGRIAKCRSLCQVSGHNYVGGFAGHSEDTDLENCYSSSGVTGNEDVGGLTGFSGWGEIKNCYSRGTVYGNNNTGGLTGDLYDCSITNSYAACIIENVGGGLAGRQDTCTFTSAFWDVDKSGKSTSAGGTPKSTFEMQNRSTFTGWDFDTIWSICDGTDYPKFFFSAKLLGDIACPDGVDFIDYSFFAKQWQLKKLSYDIAPPCPDGIVNFADFAFFAFAWDGDMNKLADFASQWLQPGASDMDFAPMPSGDGTVDFKDLQMFIMNWLVELD
jgi:hypothetical protein